MSATGARLSELDLSNANLLMLTAWGFAGFPTAPKAVENINAIHAFGMVDGSRDG